MKKLIIKLLVGLVALVLVFGICNWGYLRTDPYNTAKFKNVPDQIDICNLGASHSLYGFNFSDYSDQYSTFNFGLDSQSHQYDYIILNHYKNRMKRGGVALIVVSYPMILGRDETENADFQSMNRRYYTFLSPKEIREYSFKTDLEMQLVPFFNSKTIRGLMSAIIKGNKSDYWSRETTKQEVEIDATKAAARHVGNKIDENGKVRFNQGALDAIYKTIALCHEIGVTPILITTPFTNEYLSEIKRLAPEYYDHEFSDCIRKIQEDTGAAYYDYSRDERFKTDYSIFLNSDHLNKRGAQKFTNIIMEEVIGSSAGEMAHTNH